MSLMVLNELQNCWDAVVVGGRANYDVEPVGEVGITYEQMRHLIDSLLVEQ